MHSQLPKVAVIGVTHPFASNILYIEELVQRSGCPCMYDKCAPSEKCELDRIWKIKQWVMQDGRRSRPLIVFDGMILNITMVEAIVPFLRARGFEVEAVWIEPSQAPEMVDEITLERLERYKEALKTKTAIASCCGSDHFHAIDSSKVKPSQIRRKLAELARLPVYAESAAKQKRKKAPYPPAQPMHVNAMAPSFA